METLLTVLGIVAAVAAIIRAIQRDFVGSVVLAVVAFILIVLL